MNKNGKTKKHAGGRPPTWTSPDALQALIDTYFKNSTKPTLSGLANTVGVSRRTLYTYSQKDEFLPTIEAARDYIQQIYEEHLIYNTKTNTNGLIFALKNSGWTDRQEVDHTTKGKELPTPILGAHVYSNNSDQETSGAK